KEFLKSKEEFRESSKCGSPFTLEIKDKPLPANFKLPSLELYGGRCDPIERNQIEDLIRQGHLRRYVRDQPIFVDNRPPKDSSPRPKGPVEKQINVIIGGPASSGDSSSTRKAYA
ncbi:hypothetical protein GW17_00043889, partial [Ensete ventricosum]